MDLERTTLASYLDDALVRNETAFAHRDGLRVKRWSYPEIAKTAFQFARELEQRGIEKGDRVLIWANNRPEWVSAFFGCLVRGTIAVPIDVQSEHGFVKRVHDQVNAKLALCDGSSSEFVEQLLPVIHLDRLKEQIARHSDARYLTNIGPDDVVEIVFTSGTTAEPKGVAITHRNVLANLTPIEQEIKRFLKWERLVHPVRFLNLVPLSHVFGQFMAMFVPQLLGGEVFFQESLLPSQIVETVKRERISVVVCVPRVLESLREKIESEHKARRQFAGFQQDFNRAATINPLRRWWIFRRVHQMFGLKFWAFISGGATLNPDTEEFWQRLGFAVIQGYGMTETAAIISVNHPFKKAPGSIGKVLPGQEVKLSQNGEILVRGENVAGGYSSEGWFRTGDTGAIDSEGNLYFKGRQKEVIVTSSGMNIYPEDIEFVLDRQPEIKRNTVVEFNGPHGPEPLAVLILRDDSADAGAAVERANAAVAEHQKVRRWAIWPEPDFPLTSTQKVRKQVVADKISTSGGLRRESSSGVEQLVAQVSGEEAQTLNPEAKLGADLKLDSLGRVEFLSALEDRYQVEIDEAAFTQSTTIGEVEKLIREGRQEEATPYPYPRWQQRWPINWIRLALYYLVVWPFTRFMARPQFSGQANLRDSSPPVVFICNHVSMVDHALVLLAVPGKIRRRLAIAMDGELLREWRYPTPKTKLNTRLRNLIKYVLVVLFFNVFSMPQKSGFRRSFAFAGELMDRGYSILIFPEGVRAEQEQMNPFRPGTGLLIAKLDAPVVPLRIDGLWKLKEANKHFAKAGEIKLIIGQPVQYSTDEAPEEIVHDLECKVRGLE
jgi:long-chain acyl-CoA synthetase